MKIARCSKNDDKAFWAVINLENCTATPLIGSLKDWSTYIMDGQVSNLPIENCSIPMAELQFLAPVEHGSSTFVVGANYIKHLEEMDISPATHPHTFLKSYNALIGANDSIELPQITQQLDHEVELVTVIGSTLVAGQNPQSCILGYTVGNEVSARDLQAITPGIGMDLFAAKSLFHTNPVGPWIVTADEFESDKPDLKMTLTVNGVTHQEGRSSEMNWSPAELIYWINAISRVSPGDIIFTGTPQGVGWKAGRFLHEGDLIVAEIEKIGQLSNKVVSGNISSFD